MLDPVFIDLVGRELSKKGAGPYTMGDLMNAMAVADAGVPAETAAREEAAQAAVSDGPQQ